MKIASRAITKPCAKKSAGTLTRCPADLLNPHYYLTCLFKIQEGRQGLFSRPQITAHLKRCQPLYKVLIELLPIETYRHDDISPSCACRTFYSHTFSDQ